MRVHCINSIKINSNFKFLVISDHTPVILAAAKRETLRPARALANPTVSVVPYLEVLSSDDHEDQDIEDMLGAHL